MVVVTREVTLSVWAREIFLVAKSACFKISEIPESLIVNVLA